MAASRRRAVAWSWKWDRSELTTISVDAALARAAGELAERRALRGYDAVHLASALSIDVIVPWATEERT